jgi:hypothetical protein
MRAKEMAVFIEKKRGSRAKTVMPINASRQTVRRLAAPFGNVVDTAGLYTRHNEHLAARIAAFGCIE